MYNHKNEIVLQKNGSKEVESFKNVNQIMVVDGLLHFSLVGETLQDDYHVYPLKDYRMWFMSEQYVPVSVAGTVWRSNWFTNTTPSSFAMRTMDGLKCGQTEELHMFLFNEIPVQRDTDEPDEVLYRDEFGNPFYYKEIFCDKKLYEDNVGLLWEQEDCSDKDEMVLRPFDPYNKEE